MRRAGRVVVGVAVLGLLTGSLGGCRADDAGAVSTPTVASPSVASAPASADPLLGDVVEAPDVLAAVTRALTRRVADLTTGDPAGFRASLATRDPAFTAQQEHYYANLRQLPIQVLALTPDAATLVRDGAAYSVNVAVSIQLQGYDATPVTTTDRYRFVPTRSGRRYLLASVTDAAWEARNDVHGEPWDLGPIQVRTGAGVLGIFDDRSVAEAGPLLRSVEAGITAVSALVPYDWSHSVVLDALSDDTYLRSLPDLPGEDPDDVDAVAFSIYADASQQSIVGTRLVLQPRMLERPGASRDRLLRHELTHAAVGIHDDHAPVWLREGVAEWVSVQAQAAADRDLSRAALKAARDGFTDLPADDTFNDDDAAAHYGLSWWACEYVAQVAGPAAVWGLLDQLDALGAAGPIARADEDAALVAVAGVNTRTLARKAGKLLLATFDPPPALPTVPVPPAITLPTAPVVPPAPAPPVTSPTA